MPRFHHRYLSPLLLIAIGAATLTGLSLAVHPEPSAVSEHFRTETMPPEFASEFARLEDKRTTLKSHQSIKDMLILALIDERVTLSTVVAEFIRMNAEGESVAIVTSRYPGATDEERAARNVLDYASKRVSVERMPDLMKRLEHEFDIMFSHSAEGRVRLAP
jgi:hypothetical protein